MDRKLAVITGATGGIGSALTRMLIEEGIDVIMACRDLEKAEQIKDNIYRHGKKGKIIQLFLDLSSLVSIRNFAHHLKAENIQPDVLINNAGVMCNTYSITTDGFEKTIGTNFIGHYYLSSLLIPLIQRNPAGMILNVTSVTHKIGTIDENFFSMTPEKYGRFRCYANSKLAILLYTAWLSEQLANEKICVNAIDPGIVNTGMITMNKWYDPLADIFFRPFIKKAEQGAYPILNAIRETGEKNGYLYSGKNSRPLPQYIHQHPYKTKLVEETSKMLSL